MVYQLVCLVGLPLLLRLLCLMGATLLAKLVIQAVKFLTECSRFGTVSGWEVLMSLVHWLSNTLLQLQWGAPSGSGVVPGIW